MNIAGRGDSSLLGRLHPRRIINGIHWRLNLVRDRWVRRDVERIYRKTRPAALASAHAPCILADGMYDNPNHFYRLRLFFEAFDPKGVRRRLGVLRNRRESGARSSLEALGCQDIIFIDESAYRIGAFRDEARRMLHSVSSHEDLLALQLPEKIPAYVFFDTVLKVLRDPCPPLNHEAWEFHLAELLRNMALFADMFDKNRIQAVVFSHGWKNEYAAAFWMALRRGIPAYHLTAYYETLRIRRMTNCSDYACPKERLTYDDFERLNPTVRADLIATGWKHLQTRAQGETTDINGRRAFRSEGRPADCQAAREWLGVTDDRPVGVVFAHAWYDFPHVFALQNFTDFLDWMRETLAAVSGNTAVDWFLKPHPLESWYGAFRLADLATGLPPHVHLLPEATDSLAVTRAADVCVTVHGTIGFEAVAHGIPTICGDGGYYSDWPFVHRATSREDYRRMIAEAAHLLKPDEHQRDLAAVFAYLATGPNPEAAALTKIRCDSLGFDLYGDIIARHRNGDVDTNREIVAISNWLASDSDSYSVYTKLAHHNTNRENLRRIAVASAGGDLNVSISGIPLSTDGSALKRLDES